VRINRELGVARLSGGYLSPVCQSFLGLCREHFEGSANGDDSPPPRASSKRAKRAGKKTRAATKGRGSKSKK
jgi:hypothetical protein